MALYGEGVNRTLPIAGKEIKRVGLGTNRLTHTPENVEFIRAAVKSGVQMIDTAHLYTGGQSEAAIGEALAPLPPEVLVATKGGFGGAGRGRPEVLRSEIEESLRRLRTDVIDLYYLHRVDPETPIEESLGAIKEYVERGSIRQVGLSDVTVEQIEQAQKVVPVAAVQNHYSVSERRFEDVVDHCTAQSIPFVPYFPLRGSDRPAEALRWLLERSPMILPIPGTLSLEHLRENLAVLD